NKNYYIKRFVIETTTQGKRFSFITEGRGSKMILATTLDSPAIELTTKLKSGDKKVEFVNLTEFIDVKGWRSIGNKICGKEFHKVKLITPIEPVALPETEQSNNQEITDQKEIKPIDSKSKPKEELDKKPQKTQLKSSVKAESEPNIEQKDSYENSDSKKDKLKNVPKENVTKTNPPKIKAPKKDEDEDSKTFTSGDQISLL
ncbi:MAG: hypothetical protein P8I31_02860, partial [Bacteroidia bacterium]|nr:hypothetical protein [Bacteroidia bacterium]